MVYEIQKRLRDDLKSYMGQENKGGWYSDNLLDDNGFNIRLDDTMVVFPSVTVVGNLAAIENYEIAGRLGPTLLNYDVATIVMVQHADKSSAQELLEKLARRIMRIVWTSAVRADAGDDTLINLSNSDEGLTERVTHVYLTDMIPDSRKDSNSDQFQFMAILNFRVRTELKSISN